MALRTDWGPAFWQQYYTDPKTRVASDAELYTEGSWLMGTVMERLHIPVLSALDIGSGTGEFANGMERYIEEVERIEPYGPDPRASKMLAAEHDFKGFDILVCRDVLQYFDNKEYPKVLDKMNQSGAKVLYIRVPKKEDQKLGGKSDTQCIIRSYDSLYQHLTGYINKGMGLWIKMGTPVFLLYGE